MSRQRIDEMKKFMQIAEGDVAEAKGRDPLKAAAGMMQKVVDGLNREYEDRMNAAGDDEDEIEFAGYALDDARDYQKIVKMLLGGRGKAAAKFYDNLDTAAREFIYEYLDQDDLHKLEKVFDKLGSNWLYVEDDYLNEDAPKFCKDCGKEMGEGDDDFSRMCAACNKAGEDAHAALDEDDVKGVNDKYDEKHVCKHCGDYFCTSKFGGECPGIQRDMFDEGCDSCRFCKGLGTNEDGDPCDSCNGKMVEGPGDDEDWDAHWAREDGDEERADDLEWDAAFARMDDEDNDDDEDFYEGEEEEGMGHYNVTVAIDENYPDDIEIDLPYPQAVKAALDLAKRFKKGRWEMKKYNMQDAVEWQIKWDSRDDTHLTTIRVEPSDEADWAGSPFESIELDSIVESVLGKSQAVKDAADELGIQVTDVPMSEPEEEKGFDIGDYPEAEDEELGLRFD